MPVGLCGHVTEINRVTAGTYERGDALHVEPPRVVERDVDDVEVGADRAASRGWSRSWCARSPWSPGSRSDVAVANSAAAAPGVTKT